MADENRIPLPLLADALRRAGVEPPPYRYCLNAAMDARIPATRIVGRWYVDRRDLPQIAVAMGLTWPSQQGAVSTSKRARRAAAVAA
jgi:hypothetical protein